MSPRDPSGHITPIHRAALAAEAAVVVATYESERDAAPLPHAGTLGDALALALDPKLGKRHATGSTQPTEWRRARDEALIVLPEATALTTLAASSSVLVGSSALLRQAASCTLPDWREHVVRARADAKPTDSTEAVLLHAYRAATTASAAAADLKLAWAIRACQLVRTMLLHAAKEVPDTMAAGARFVLASDLRERLRELAQRIDKPLDLRVQRGRPPLDATRTFMRFLSDPRQQVHSLLATAVGEVATGRVKRSHLDRTADGYLRVRPTKTDGTVPMVGQSLAGWKYLPSREATALFDALHARWYSAEEAAYQRDPARNDYSFLHGYEWDGLLLVPSATARWQWMDPRLRLLLVLGAEGRLLQFLRLRFSDIEQTESGHMVIRSQGAANKRMSDLILCDAQVDWLTFELQCGYLSALHTEFRDGRLPDFPLFRTERLVAGRLPVDASPHPQVDDKPVADANRKLLELLGIPKPKDVNLRVWRRLFADLYRTWGVSPEVQEAITGHDPVAVSAVVMRASGAVPRQSSLRVYLDPAEEQLLLRAARVMQHTRTTYAATGAPCPPLR